MPLHRLLYRSEITLPGSETAVRHQIDAIVAESEARNAAAELTGALLYVRGLIVQVLEGPLPAIEATFERICCDLRHRRVELLELTQAEGRMFGSWSMTHIRVGHDLDALLPTRLIEIGADGASAHATINLMRSLLTAGAARAASQAEGEAAATARASLSRP
ncbi:BLUF domain-containing protein [Methylobacterium sp. ID0610]|uniref:BLUF domain-containing protein n=1 Tax=Methylobacterium carpenticola TaxID=3344827 RepID=UPI003699B97A